MFNWNDVKNLHVVKKTEDIIHRWWKTETLILNADLLPDLIDNSIQTLSFKNKWLESLFQHPTFKQAFFEKIQAVQKQSSPENMFFMEKWPGTGLYLLIIPFYLHDHLSGYVVGTGFIFSDNEEEDRQNIKKAWLEADLSEQWVGENIANVPVIKPENKNYFIDLMEVMAREIVSVQKEITEKTQSVSRINQRSNSLCYGNMVGKSKVMHQLYNLLEKIKHSQNNILIEGENGTGKELIAKSIHENSLRTGQIFVAQNCSALNDNLLESELFGHVKGSFTGAYKDKKGLFEQADKGTFLLDEVGDTSPMMQVKLLRVLQEGVFFPVGSVEPKKVDVRIIAATNRNLKKMVEEGQFREDLYYRLNVINIHVPPLRERKEDIVLLAEFFINRFSQQPKVFTKKTIDKLLQYPWPGNVRELQNEAERLAIFSTTDTYIKEDFLSEKIRNKEENQHLINSLNDGSSGKSMKKAIAQLEKQMILRGLKEERWNKTRVAKKLGISRAALVTKVKDYNLDKRKHQLMTGRKKV